MVDISPYMGGFPFGTEAKEIQENKKGGYEMKVNETNTFDCNFPEMYHWGSVDSVLADNVSNDIINMINHNMKTVDRSLIPGLRAALNILARHTNA